MYHACRTYKRRTGPTQISFDATHIVIRFSQLPLHSRTKLWHRNPFQTRSGIQFIVRVFVSTSRHWGAWYPRHPGVSSMGYTQLTVLWTKNVDFWSLLEQPTEDTMATFFLWKIFLPVVFVSSVGLEWRALQHLHMHKWTMHKVRIHDYILFRQPTFPCCDECSFRQSESESSRPPYPFCWHLSALHWFIFPSTSTDYGTKIFTIMSRIQKTKKRFKSSCLPLSSALCFQWQQKTNMIQTRHIYTSGCLKQEEERNRRETMNEFGGCATADTAMRSLLLSPERTRFLFDQTQEKSIRTICRIVDHAYSLALWTCAYVGSCFRLLASGHNAPMHGKCSQGDTSIDGPLLTLCRGITKTMLRRLSRITQGYQRRDRGAESHKNKPQKKKNAHACMKSMCMRLVPKCTNHE